MRWTIRKAVAGYPYDSEGASIVGPDTDPVVVISASFTDEDVERVAEAIYAVLEDSYSIARETTEAPTKVELLAAARAALTAYLTKETS